MFSTASLSLPALGRKRLTILRQDKQIKFRKMYVRLHQIVFTSKVENIHFSPSVHLYLGVITKRKQIVSSDSHLSNLSLR